MSPREQLQQLYERAVEYVRQRNAREQLLLGLAAAGLIFVLVQSIAIAPLQEALERQRADLERTAREREQVRNQLAPGLQRLREQLAQVEERVRPGTQTNLQALIGQLAQEVGVNIERLGDPRAGARNERYPEERIQVELRGASLDQLVEFLYKIEHAEIYLIVRSLSIRARSDDEQSLDVSFSVSSFERA